jgi:hypothetical protein
MQVTPFGGVARIHQEPGRTGRNLGSDTQFFKCLFNQNNDFGFLGVANILGDLEWVLSLKFLLEKYQQLYININDYLYF